MRGAPQSGFSMLIRRINAQTSDTANKEPAIIVREPDATMQPTLQDNQLMSKHLVLSFEPQLRVEWRGQGGQSETEQPDHSASLGDSITSSTRIRFSVHTVTRPYCPSIASCPRPRGESMAMLFAAAPSLQSFEPAESRELADRRAMLLLNIHFWVCRDREGSRQTC